MLFIAQHAHQPLSTFNMDQHLEGVIRFHSSKFAAIPASIKAEHTSYETQAADVDYGRSYEPTQDFNESIKVLFQQTESYSNWIHLNTPGFLPNQRSHASFGIAVLQVRLRKIFYLIRSSRTSFKSIILCVILCVRGNERLSVLWYYCVMAPTVRIFAP